MLGCSSGTELGEHPLGGAAAVYFAIIGDLCAEQLPRPTAGRFYR